MVQHAVKNCQILQVYGTGQPTEEGMVAILNKAKEGKDGAKVLSPILLQWVAS